jgi:hypothetical protein
VSSYSQTVMIGNMLPYHDRSPELSRQLIFEQNRRRARIDDEARLGPPITTATGSANAHPFSAARLRAIFSASCSSIITSTR